MQERIFHYCLSRARCTVENAYSILSYRFRIFMTPISLNIEKVKVITMVCCVLHYYLWSRVTARTIYTPPRSLDSEDPISHELNQGDSRSSKTSAMEPLGKEEQCLLKSSKDNQTTFCDYFNSVEGEEPWHCKMI